MNNSKTTKKALISSVLSLILCCTMLLGTTFAWFTDSVTSSNNIIKSGKLDVTMDYAEGAEDPAAANWKDASDVAIFNYDKWEPGYVDAKHLKIANIGSLAFNYQLRIVTNGELGKLADVIDVYYFAPATKLDRATVANVADDTDTDTVKHLGTLTDLFTTAGNIANTVKGMLVSEEDANADANDNLISETTLTLAFKMKETAGNEYQNLEVTNSFSIELIATQATFEDDSFGTDYDADAPSPEIPAALVRRLAEDDLDIKYTLGIGGAAEEGTLDAGYKFEPTISYEEAQDSIYRYWHADFVVKADKDVPADSIALAGYYDAWCKYNNNNWVAMVNEGADIDANTEIRLVELLGTTVNWEEICHLGNDGLGFQCGLADLTGANAGTTVTVELRIYEVGAQGECANGGGCTHPTTACEISPDNYITVGTFTYTFGVKSVSAADDLKDALEDKDVTEIALSEDVTLDETIKIKTDKVIYLNGNDLTSETGSRPFQVYGGNLTIDATGSNVELDKYGLVDIKEGDVKITIIGGTFTGELDNGAVIKGRANTKAELYLENVNMTFTDSSAKGSYVYNPDKSASATTVIEGGVYNIDCGFIGNVTMKNATVNAKGFIFNGGGSIENCTLTTDGSSKAPADAAPFCCVAASNDRTVTVKNSTLTATNCNAIEIYPTGGIVTVTDSTVTGACYKHPLYDAQDNCSITIDGVEQ